MMKYTLSINSQPTILDRSSRKLFVGLSVPSIIAAAVYLYFFASETGSLHKTVYFLGTVVPIVWLYLMAGGEDVLLTPKLRGWVAVPRLQCCLILVAPMVLQLPLIAMASSKHFEAQVRLILTGTYVPGWIGLAEELVGFVILYLSFAVAHLSLFMWVDSDDQAASL